MIVLAVDPGPTKSGFIFWDTEKEITGAMGEYTNEQMRNLIYKSSTYNIIVIEDIVMLGQTFVGKEIFNTAKWAGRFWEIADNAKTPVHWINRRQVKLNLCETNRAKDKNIRAALIERFGKPGTKKEPGRLYGVSGHIWSALALGVTYADLNKLSPIKSQMLTQ